MQSMLAFRSPSPGDRTAAEAEATAAATEATAAAATAAAAEAEEVAATAPSFSSYPVEDDAGSEVPLLRREASGSRRRRTANDSCLVSISMPPTRRRSFSRDVGHAAAETYLLTRLTLILLRYLGVGYRWITRFLALVCYAILLMPGFVQVGYYYFFSTQVRRSIVYGDQPRNRLDLYLPTDSNGSKPVVAFVTGGAWIIGYKAWGSLLGRRLAERGIIVACLDYRNFPQGTISDMIKDSSTGISFVCNNISIYGGDPNQIYLVGQSAGAHIAACALVHQAIKECEGESISWSVSQMKAYFGLSGGYNLLNLVDHFHRRGLYRSIFLGIMEGEQSLRHFSPEVVIRDLKATRDLPPLPPIILYHGTGDYSIPSDASISFAEALQSMGVRSKVVLYEGKTHTDLFLQVVLRGWNQSIRSKIKTMLPKIAYLFSFNFFRGSASVG